MGKEEISNELKPYVPVVDMIARTFGKYCEVVLHDLSFPSRSVVYVANGHVTGREVGQPIHHLFTVVLKSRDFKDDSLCNYTIKNKKGEDIKSSTALIRNANGTVIGALCINYDTTVLEGANEFLQDLLAPSTRQEVKNGEETPDHVTEISNDLIKKIIGNSNPKDLNREQRVDLIEFMDKKGIFLIKGSVETVASMMDVSAVTIYSYLDAVKKRTSV